MENLLCLSECSAECRYPHGGANQPRQDIKGSRARHCGRERIAREQGRNPVLEIPLLDFEIIKVGRQSDVYGTLSRASPSSPANEYMEALEG